MTDYALVRSRSVVLPSALDRSPTVLVGSGLHTPSIRRTTSVPDLTGYIRYSDRYKPHWHSVSSYRRTVPWRYSRDYDLWQRYAHSFNSYDNYWLMRTDYWPYTSTYWPRRYSYSDYYPSSFWYPYSSYWNRYKSNWYDYDYPSYYSRYWDPVYRSHLRSNYWTPYSSYVLDTAEASLQRGLAMYREGQMNYNTLYNYFLTPNYWDKRFKDWRQLYINDIPRFNNVSYGENNRKYIAQWV